MFPITIYRSHCSVYRLADGYTPAAWEEWGFGPSPGFTRIRPVPDAIWAAWRSASEPVQVGSRLGTMGLDAGSIAYLAGRREKGFFFVGGDEVASKRRDNGGPALFAGFHEEPGPEPGASAYPRAATLPVGVQAARETAQALAADGVQVECPGTLELLPDGSTVLHALPADVLDPGLRAWAQDDHRDDPGAFRHSGRAIDDRDRMRAQVAELARQVIEPAMEHVLGGVRRALDQVEAIVAGDEEYPARLMTVRTILQGLLEG